MLKIYTHHIMIGLYYDFWDRLIRKFKKTESFWTNWIRLSFFWVFWIYFWRKNNIWEALYILIVNSLMEVAWFFTQESTKPRFHQICKDAYVRNNCNGYFDKGWRGGGCRGIYNGVHIVPVMKHVITCNGVIKNLEFKSYYRKCIL